MEMSPQQVRNASFKTAKRGFDPDEVQTFLRDVAESLEAAQNQATAMEARARAAVARLQEASTARETAEPARSEDAETISRTLLLAQRTADATVADAKAEAERIVTAAHEEAASTIDSTREMSARMLEEARTEARQVSEVERKAAQSEVDALVARREFLEADVDHLEHFLVDQRDRLRQAASALLDISERVPGGLGAMRRPLLSASDDAAPLESRTPSRPGEPSGDDGGESGGADEHAAAPGGLYEPAAEAHDDPYDEPPDERPGGDDPTLRIDVPPTAPPEDRGGDNDRHAGATHASHREEQRQFRFGVGDTRPYD